MKFSHSSSRILLLAVFLLASFQYITGCEIYDGDLPPQDELQTPVSLAMHPSGKYLYVLNSNYTGKYRTDLGGSLTIVDLDTLDILDDQTLCLPSFGSDLAFSASHYGTDEPRYLVGLSKSSGGAFVLSLNAQGNQIACDYKGKDIGNTCVQDITSLAGVSKKTRRLPCEIPTIMNDPSAIEPIAPIEGVTPDDQDAFMIVGQRNGTVAALNLVDGDIRGKNAKGARHKSQHLSSILNGVIQGADVLATHPLTGEIYAAGRNDRRIFAVRWLRNPIADPADHPTQGFAKHVAVTGGLQLKPATNRLEIRSMHFSEDGTRLYATARGPGSLFEIDTSRDDNGNPRNKQIRRILISGAPSSFDIVKSQGNTYAYVALFNSRKIAVINLDSGKRIATIDVGATPYAVLADPARSRLYVSLFEDNAVAVIDTDPSHASWNREIATIH